MGRDGHKKDNGPQGKDTCGGDGRVKRVGGQRRHEGILKEGGTIVCHTSRTDY